MEEEPKKHRMFVDYTARQWLCLFNIVNTQFLKGIASSIRAPIFPLEATSKGATPFQYGLVLGVFRLCQFLVSPVIGEKINRVGVKKTMFLGLLECGLLTIAQGCLEWVNGADAFIYICCLLRAIESIGFTAFQCASFTALRCEFTVGITTLFSIMECIKGIGYIIGPTVAGVLFEDGGFILPMSFLGGCMVLASALCICTLPNDFGEEEYLAAAEEKKALLANSETNLSTTSSSADSQTKYKDTMWEMLLIPGVFISTCCMFIGADALNFAMGLLATHLKKDFPDLTPLQIGEVFTVFGAFYTVGTPVFGMLRDFVSGTFDFDLCDPMNLCGVIMLALSFAFMGPVAFLHKILPLTYGVMIAMCAFNGLGNAAVRISRWPVYKTEALANGFKDNVRTNGLISGIWAGSYAFGSCFGPLVGGLLINYIGFDSTCMVFFVMACIVFVMALFYSTSKLFKSRGKTDDTVEPA